MRATHSTLLLSSVRRTQSNDVSRAANAVSKIQRFKLSPAREEMANITVIGILHSTDVMVSYPIA